MSGFWRNVSRGGVGVLGVWLLLAGGSLQAMQEVPPVSEAVAVQSAAEVAAPVPLELQQSGGVNAAAEDVLDTVTVSESPPQVIGEEPDQLAGAGSVAEGGAVTGATEQPLGDVVADEARGVAVEGSALVESLPVVEGGVSPEVPVVAEVVPEVPVAAEVVPEVPVVAEVVPEVPVVAEVVPEVPVVAEESAPSVVDNGGDFAVGGAVENGQLSSSQSGGEALKASVSSFCAIKRPAVKPVPVVPPPWVVANMRYFGQFCASCHGMLPPEQVDGLLRRNAQRWAGPPSGYYAPWFWNAPWSSGGWNGLQGRGGSGR
ncbi:MAG: hypothetical protein HQM04_10910 [Magnetococcales bacterium]|nr:hypothetical protein [Magnetococcales bacterium]MBF0115534.1 hypothetical protein [Magnetococcales bacterium]